MTSDGGSDASCASTIFELDVDEAVKNSRDAAVSRKGRKRLHELMKTVSEQYADLMHPDTDTSDPNYEQEQGDFDTDWVNLYGQIANWAHHTRQCWPSQDETNANGRILLRAWKAVSKWYVALELMPPFDKNEVPDAILDRQYFFPDVRKKSSHGMKKRSNGPSGSPASSSLRSPDPT